MVAGTSGVRRPRLDGVAQVLLCGCCSRFENEHKLLFAIGKRALAVICPSKTQTVVNRSQPTAPRKVSVCQ